MYVHTRKGAGFSIVEVIVGLSIAVSILTFTSYAIVKFVNAGRDASARTKAIYLAEDGLELLRYKRDQNWTNISSLPLNTNRYLSVGTSTVAITTTQEIIDGYYRSFRVTNVYRNPITDDIVASTSAGSVADTSAKYVTMTVGWGSPSTTVSITSILADIAL